MNKLGNVLVFTLCAFALVAARAGQTSSKPESPYPNELPNLKLHEQAKWGSLRPYVSTIDDVERLLGKPVAVYDELLHTYVAGFQDDPDWTVMINVVGEGMNLPVSVAGRVLSIELYPKKRVSLVGAEFSAFRGATYMGPNEETTSYYDEFGLRYVVFEKDTANGRFHAGDLKRIDYGPSDAATVKLNATGEFALKQGIDLSIVVENSQWKKEAPILVRLRAHNLTKVDLSGLCAFVLVKQSDTESEEDWNRFSGPVHLQNSESTPTLRPVPSKFEADQQLDLKIDITKLKWGRSVQAVWPANDLSAVVPPRNYQFYFEISLKDGQTVKLFKSNDVKISLQ